MFAVSQTTNSLVDSGSNKDNSHVFSNVFDAIALLVHADKNLSLVRKKPQIKPAIKQEYFVRYTLEDLPDARQ